MTYSAILPASSSGSSSSDHPSGGGASSRRRSPTPTNLYGIYSSSDESSCWSPPDTPTPITYAPLPRKARLQAGPRSSSSSSCSAAASASASSSFSRVQASLRQHAHAHAQFAFSVPTVKRAPTSYLHYRGTTDALASDHTDVGDSDSDTDVDGEATETELGTALSDVESQINDKVSEGFTADHEGDEVDMVLLDSTAESDSAKDYKMYPAPSSPWADRKGKRRVRVWDDEKMNRMPCSGSGSRSCSDEDGDDEMETEGLLRVKGKGRRPTKSARKLSSYPDEKMSTSTGSVVGNICDRMGGLHASSTIIAMNMDTSMSSSGFACDVKNPNLVAYQTASQRAGIQSRGQGARARKTLTRKRVRGQQKRCFQRLTASEDPLVNLPALRDFRGVLTSNRSKSPASEGSSMDVSDAEDQALVDAEMSSTSTSIVPSDIDMKSVSSLDVSRTSPTPRKFRIRATYERDIPLAKVRSQAAVEESRGLSMRGMHGRTRLRAFPERMSGQASTSHLHRSSPSSLLPARRYMTRSHRPPIVTHKYRPKPARVEFTICISGQSLLVALRARLAAQRNRRQRVANLNEESRDGEWRRMVGNWWGHDQVVRMVNKWWIAPVSAGPDEVEVEDILLAQVDQEDEIMLSPPTSPVALNRSKKRSSQEVAEEDRAIGAEFQDRWARRNQLRLQELEIYNATLRAQREARKEEERRAAAEAIRIRLAQIAETRRVEEIRQREAALRAEEEERRRLERAERDEAVRVARLARAAREAEELHRRREEAEAEAEAARLALQAPPSPSPTESSTISDPPEYEFPFYPVILPRAGAAASMSRRPVSPPAPVLRRIQDSRRPLLELLPDYVPDRWTNRSPPPPPPYNATTDCQTLIAPIFIEDDDDEEAEDEDDTIMSDGDDADEVDLASPLVPSRAQIRRLARSSVSPEPGMIGAFPNRQLFAPVPIRHAQLSSSTVDPIRAFEAAIDLEEGGEDDEDAVEGAFDLDERDSVDNELGEQENGGTGNAVAGVFQRVFGLVWGPSSARR
ncbi:hypothetical protein I317_06064 [Kwoniella heveanensis CBS 569]|nr:hypothetical protein I317_06064 [Kwoniella heveanensis CBS 569]